jgi:hypothetical protein
LSWTARPPGARRRGAGLPVATAVLTAVGQSGRGITANTVTMARTLQLDGLGGEVALREITVDSARDITARMTAYGKLFGDVPADWTQPRASPANTTALCKFSDGFNISRRLGPRGLRGQLQRINLQRRGASGARAVAQRPRTNTPRPLETGTGPDSRARDAGLQLAHRTPVADHHKRRQMKATQRELWPNRNSGSILCVRSLISATNSTLPTEPA